MVQQVASSDTSLRLLLIGTLIAAITYGLLTAIFLHCLVLLIRSKRRSYTNRVRSFLIVYIVTMFLLSTVAIIQGFVYVVKAISGEFAPTSITPLATNAPITLPFAIWGADGVMLWRCMVLFANESYFRRTILYLILFLCGFLSCGSGILYYLIPDIPIFAGRNSPPLLATAITICTTGITNLILTSLISGRVWFHQQRMRRILGPQYGSPYHRLIITCVESCFLIVITFLAFVVLFALGVGVIETAIIPLLLLPHICVLSPIMIVYHVARGRALTTIQPPPNITPNSAGDNSGQRTSISSIQFRHTTADATGRSHPQDVSININVESVDSSLQV